MSPTIFYHKSYRFFFFSREEKRMHIHVSCPNGEAKFWIEPVIELAVNKGLKDKDLKEAEKQIGEKMKSKPNGKNISGVEVLNVSPHGFWLLVKENEYFLDFDLFPWFRSASIGELFDVQLLHEEHLFWKELDVDLDLDSIRNPEKYPLVAKELNYAQL